jgi:hypothetical protein
MNFIKIPGQSYEMVATPCTQAKMKEAAEKDAEATYEEFCEPVDTERFISGARWMHNETISQIQKIEGQLQEVLALINNIATAPDLLEIDACITKCRDFLARTEGEKK